MCRYYFSFGSANSKQNILLERDVETLNGVMVKEISQAVSNYPEKLDFGYIFIINKYENSELVKIFNWLNILKTVYWLQLHSLRKDFICYKLF